MNDEITSIDGGLLARFRSAGSEIAWRPVAVVRPAKRGNVPSQRIAHLHDEEARVEESRTKGGRTIVVDSGPVGALVLLLEIESSGRPASLVAREAGVRDGFSHGALEAVWGTAPPTEKPRLPLADLVGLARYALA